MIGRRILQNRASTTGCRWLYPYISSPPSPVLAMECKRYFPNYMKVASSLTNNPVNFFSNAVAYLPVNGMVDVPLAQTGEGIAECELLKWFVQEGDEVEEFQPLCEVQSDKATIEITSRYKGKVAHILHVPGSIVKVADTLLKMVVEATQYRWSPIHNRCWNLAKEHGVNINDVQGGGKDGRILKEDVLKFAIQKGIIKESPVTSAADLGELFHVEKSSSQVSAQVAECYEDTIFPVRGLAYLWKMIIGRLINLVGVKSMSMMLPFYSFFWGFQRRMVKTMSMAAKVPHFHCIEEINCDTLAELKASFQTNNTEPGIKFTFLPILIKSLSMALSKYPMVNSCFNEESLELTLRGSHNIGIAMATANGLVVPNIKNVQSLSTLEINKELSRLQKSAMDNKLSPTDISSGTITLSNIVVIGRKFGSAIINLPEVAIIAKGRIQKLPQLADDGNVHPASIMTVNIGADHRVLDGATVARFCNEWKQFIEKPELLLLHMK